jgi:hypothetical protein
MTTPTQSKTRASTATSGSASTASSSLANASLKSSSLRKESKMTGFTGFVETPTLRKLPIRITKYVKEPTDAVDMRVLARSSDASRFASHVREALQSPFFLDLFDDPVPVNKTLIAVCGDFTSAALLTHLTQRLWGTLAILMVNGEPVYLPNAIDEMGRKWCITSLAELAEMTCLTPAELKRARRNLVQQSLVMEGGVKRCPNALAFALNEQAIDRATTAAAVNKYLATLPMQEETESAEFSEPAETAEAGKAANDTLKTAPLSPIVPEVPRNVLAPLDEIDAVSTRRKSK